MSQQIHWPSTNSGITNLSRDFVALVLSGPPSPRAAVSRYSHINALTLAARPAGPNATRTLKNFFKNNSCRDVKTTAIRIADGDHFGMEELLKSQPKPERQFWKVAVQFCIATKDDASSVPKICANNRTEQARAPYGDHFRVKQKFFVRMAKNFGHSHFRLGRFAHDKRSKIPAPPPRSEKRPSVTTKFLAKVENIRPFAESSRTICS